MAGQTYIKYFERDYAINVYLNDIAHYTPPTPEEELELVKLIKKGDKEALSKLMMGHQRLIFAMAKKYAKNREELTDYVSEGNIGLLSALNNYDEARGVRFISYAAFYIRRQMNQFLTFSRDQIDLTNVRRFGAKIKKIKKEYFNEYGFMPSSEDIISLFEEKHGIKIKNTSDVYDVVMNNINEHVSGEDNTLEHQNMARFNEVTYQENDVNILIENDHNKIMLNEAMKNLSEKEIDIIKMFFGMGEYQHEMHVDDVAAKYNVTASAMRMIKNKIIQKLKKYLLKNYAA